MGESSESSHKDGKTGARIDAAYKKLLAEVRGEAWFDDFTKSDSVTHAEAWLEEQPAAKDVIMRESKAPDFDGKFSLGHFLSISQESRVLSTSGRATHDFRMAIGGGAEDEALWVAGFDTSSDDKGRGR